MDKIKHLFETRSGMISKIKLSDYAYGDHKMLEFMKTKCQIKKLKIPTSVDNHKYKLL